MQITSGNHSDFGIVIRRQDFGYTSESLPSLLCLDLKVPMARIYLDATVTEGLQYAVDDLSGQIKKLTTGDEVIAEVSRRLANASDESRRKSVSEEASSSNDSMPSKSADSISVKVSFALEESRDAGLELCLSSADECFSPCYHRFSGKRSAFFGVRRITPPGGSSTCDCGDTPR